MLNCYGLRELHQYLNLPFLRMKQQLLIEQLSRASSEMVSELHKLEIGLEETKYHEFASTFAVKQKEATTKIAENREKKAKKMGRIKFRGGRIRETHFSQLTL